MQTRAVIEVAAEADPNLRSRLAVLAYRLGQTGLVVLALRGLSRCEVDRLFDPIVTAVGLISPGTFYVEADDPAAVLGYIHPGCTVIGTTDRFCSTLRSRGIPVLRAEEALQQTEDMIRPPRVVAPLSVA
jgi:hypothetical protein